mmetsp:Transcript_11837/g.12207  ORF Transcript_11837/g.12207 Transcript_11837/m.12207 type:complete len:86 (+) Transcript_11837:64-321(+)
MTYINSDGTLTEQRSNFRLSFLTDIFWSVFDVIGIFVQTLFYPSYRPSNRSQHNTRTHTTRSTPKSGPNIRGVRNLGPMNCASGG